MKPPRMTVLEFPCLVSSPCSSVIVAYLRAGVWVGERRKRFLFGVDVVSWTFIRHRLLAFGAAS